MFEDFSDAQFRVTLFRKDPPDDKPINEEKRNGKKPNMLLLMKSPVEAGSLNVTPPVKRGRLQSPTATVSARL
jgi:hypothetical protein